MLLEYGADVHKAITLGVVTTTPLNYARQNYPDIVELLLKYSTKELNQAIKERDPNKVRIALGKLQEQNIDINQIDSDGKTALHYAVSPYYWLLDRPYSIDEYNNSMHTEHLPPANQEVVQLLLEHGADVNKADGNQEIPLNHAIEGNYSDIVRLLLENGADVNKVNYFKNTPLMYALEIGSIDMLKLLLTFNPKLNEKNTYGNTALYYTAEEEHWQHFKLLLDNDADFDEEIASLDILSSIERSKPKDLYGIYESLFNSINHSIQQKKQVEKQVETNLTSFDFMSKQQHTTKETDRDFLKKIAKSFLIAENFQDTVLELPLCKYVMSKLIEFIQQNNNLDKIDLFFTIIDHKTSIAKKIINEIITNQEFNKIFQKLSENSQKIILKSLIQPDKLEILNKLLPKHPKLNKKLINSIFNELTSIQQRIILNHYLTTEKNKETFKMLLTSIPTESLFQLFKISSNATKNLHEQLSAHVLLTLKTFLVRQVYSQINSFFEIIDHENPIAKEIINEIIKRKIPIKNFSPTIQSAVALQQPKKPSIKPTIGFNKNPNADFVDPYAPDFVTCLKKAL